MAEHTCARPYSVETGDGGGAEDAAARVWARGHTPTRSTAWRGRAALAGQRPPFPPGTGHRWAVRPSSPVCLGPLRGLPQG